MSANGNDQSEPLTERTEPISGRKASARSSNNLQHSVELHIEELVLDGFASGDRYLIGEAVERELIRLFTEQGAPSAKIGGGEITHLNGGAFEISAGSNAATIGMQLAKAIYGGLDK
jgi:hypothetical protein